MFFFYFVLQIIKTKFKQWWSTIPPISTKLTIISVTACFLVLACYRFCYFFLCSSHIYFSFSFLVIVFCVIDSFYFLFDKGCCFKKIVISCVYILCVTGHFYFCVINLFLLVCFKLFYFLCVQVFFFFVSSRCFCFFLFCVIFVFYLSHAVFVVCYRLFLYFEYYRLFLFYVHYRFFLDWGPHK